MYKPIGCIGRKPWFGIAYLSFLFLYSSVLPLCCLGGEPETEIADEAVDNSTGGDEVEKEPWEYAGRGVLKRFLTDPYHKPKIEPFDRQPKKPREIERFCELRGDPISSGFVFFKGRYIEPPYVVSRRGVDVWINDFIVVRGCWPLPTYPKPEMPEGMKSLNSKKFYHYRRQYNDYLETVCSGSKDYFAKYAKFLRGLPFVKKVEDTGPSILEGRSFKITTIDGKSEFWSISHTPANPTKWPANPPGLICKLNGIRDTFDSFLHNGDCIFVGPKWARFVLDNKYVSEELPKIVEIVRSAVPRREKIRRLYTTRFKRTRMYLHPYRCVVSMISDFTGLLDNFRASDDLDRRLARLTRGAHSTAEKDAGDDAKTGVFERHREADDPGPVTWDGGNEYFMTLPDEELDDLWCSIKAGRALVKDPGRSAFVEIERERIPGWLRAQVRRQLGYRLRESALPKNAADLTVRAWAAEKNSPYDTPSYFDTVPLKSEDGETNYTDTPPLHYENDLLAYRWHCAGVPLRAVVGRNVIMFAFPRDAAQQQESGVPGCVKRLLKTSGTERFGSRYEVAFPWPEKITDGLMLSSAPKERILGLITWPYRVDIVVDGPTVSVLTYRSIPAAYRFQNGSTWFPQAFNDYVLKKQNAAN